MGHRCDGLQRGADASLSPQLQGLAVGNSTYLPHQALNFCQLRLGGQALISGGHSCSGTKCFIGYISGLTWAYMIGFMPMSDGVAVGLRIIVRGHGSLGVCMFSLPAFAGFHHTFDHHRGFDYSQQTLIASRVRLRVRAIALARRV